MVKTTITTQKNRIEEINEILSPLFKELGKLKFEIKEHERNAILQALYEIPTHGAKQKPMRIKEIQKLLDCEISNQKLVGVLRALRFEPRRNNRGKITGVRGKYNLNEFKDSRIIIHTTIDTKRFAEIDENGKVVNGGSIIERKEKFNTYAVVE